MTTALTRGLAAVLCLLAGAAAPLPAQAHKPSDAYLTLAMAADGRISQRLDIALRDLDRDLDLDADADGQLRWGEVRACWGALEQLADATVVVQADGQPCRRRWPSTTGCSRRATRRTAASPASTGRAPPRR